MLTLQRASQGRRSGRSIGLALAGGGPLGAFYELGALHALSEAVDGLDLTALDVYVGVSSGSIVAAALANGFDTTTMGSIFITNDSSRYPFAPSLFVRPAVAQYMARAVRLPALLSRALRDYASDPVHAVWAGAMGTLMHAVPVSLFDNEPIGEFLGELFSSPGHTDDFRKLRTKLFVVSTNLNTGIAVRFGEPGFDDVPISRAIMASTALPGLYSSVQIDGQSYVDGALNRTMNASLAFDAGCDLVLCVNPLVPFDAMDGPEESRVDLARSSLATILSQMFRAMIQSRMQVGMANYQTRYPAADQVLFEPDRNDARMFFVNVFRYADRQQLVNHAYQRMRYDLRRHSDELAPVLARHGLSLRQDVLRDRRRRFSTAVVERATAARRVTQDLSDTLSRLEIELKRLAAKDRRSR